MLISKKCWVNPIFMAAICWAVIIGFGVAWCEAAEETCAVEWAYNGAIVPGSFVLYNGGAEVFNAPAAERAWTGTITLTEGDNVFTIAAVDAEGIELARSSPYIREYIDGGCVGTRTIQMKMTWEVIVP